jgi:hypothetical protein
MIRPLSGQKLIMKQLSLLVSACALMACSSISWGQALTLNFGPNTGSSLQFNGVADSFNFNSGTNGHLWNITSESGGSSAQGLNGDFLGGPFHYGPVITSGFLESANLLPGSLSTLSIYDGSGYLTGTVNFGNVETVFGSFGILNSFVNVNLTGITYTGGNADLQTLVTDQPGTLDVTFQFASGGMDLNALSAGTGPYATSYSGSITVNPPPPAPEPGTLVLAGLGGLASLLAIRRRK